MQHRTRPVLISLIILLVCWIASMQLGGITASAAPSGDGVWRSVDQATIVRRGERLIVPTKYRTVAVNPVALGQRLGNAPLERSNAARQPEMLTLPLPDGTFGRFVIAESPIMEPGLAAQFPTIKTYTAQGLDDPTASGRLDRTPAGFHAILLTAQGTVYIDPYSRNDVEHYISYYKHDFVPSPAKLQARSQEVFDEDDLPTPSEVTAGQAQRLPPTGPSLKTYRLAVAATGEYTTFHGGTVAAAQAAIVTSVNRVNAVYEREVAVRMVLVANNSSVVYTNGANDPYTNNNGSTMLGQNQTNLNNVIGSANYDIGHVFSTGGGGVATLGSVCSASNKARGVTGSPSPVGDAFDIDYVAHEMGHQFGGNHTFNGTTGSCGGGNRSSGAAYEPGSGTTIMAYAGICGAENVQPNSDDDFHTKSFDEISTFVATGGGASCGTTTPTGNSAPVVNAGPDYTIPSRTPFELVGSATDPNGDALTYDWEEFDLGPAAPPNTDANGSARPVFRSFLAKTNPVRTFPQTSDLLNNTTTLGEALPTINRTMNFRLTARDNRAGGGGSNYDTMQVVISNTGPFAVTTPNTAVTWGGGTSETVVWSVASTNVAPVSCANVNILLSTDGGLTFPTTLLANTSNDGTQVITVPNTPTTQARVKVVCATSIFFDISNVNFTITGGATATGTPPTSTPTVPTATGTVVPPTSTNTATGLPTATNTPIAPGGCLTEGFDVVPPVSWVVVNNSNPVGSTSWFQGDSMRFAAQAGAATSYAAANFNNTTGTGDISTWLLSLPLTIKNGDVLTFYTRKSTPNPTDYPDRMQVRLSTNGTSTNVGTGPTGVGDFTTLLLDINPTLATGGYPLNWQQFSVTISGLPNSSTGRIAFRYFVTNGGPDGANSDYIGVDTFSYCTPLNTPTSTATSTETATVPTATNTATATVPTATNSPTVTVPSPTGTGSITPSHTSTPTATVATATNTPTVSPSTTPTLTVPTATNTATNTPTLTTPTATPTVATHTSTPTVSPSNTPTLTVPTATNTATNTPTFATSTATPPASTSTRTATILPNNTPTATAIPSITNTPTPVADVELQGSTQPTTGVAGNVLTYTLTLTNTGPNIATGVVVTTTIPSGVTFVSASSGCTLSGNVVACTLSSLAVNAPATLSIQLRPSQSGVVVLVSGVDSNETDPNPANNNATTLITVLQPTPTNTAVPTATDVATSTATAQPTATETIPMNTLYLPLLQR